MSLALPILTAIRGEWNAIGEAPVLGKDVLELLSSSMYVNSLAVYREYIQNATDSIDEAVAVGLLAKNAEGRVDINIDAGSRTITIRDNGTGIPHSEFVKRLIALGASRKRGRKARGFRGVGRLAGLGYCQELVFRSRCEGEREVSELRWDCKKLKLLLRDSQISDQLGEIIRQVVRFRKTVEFGSPTHFFEVELRGLIRNGSDVLMNTTAVSRYLSKTAPVPFSPEFKFREEIDRILSREFPMTSIAIFINGAEDPLYRPHRNTFFARKGVADHCSRVEPIEIKNGNGEVSAVGWLLHHGYQGAIPKDALIGGLRLRCGNIQVGEDDLLDGIFAEPRFNAWSVGEVHVLDERILPNGRRDHFEQNIHFSDLLNRLMPFAHELTRMCRQSSIQRNLTRQYEAKLATTVSSLLVVEQGAIPESLRERYGSEIRANLTILRKLIGNLHQDKESDAPDLQVLAKLEKHAEVALKANRLNAQLSKRYVRERNVYEHVFGLIYECSSDTGHAKALIDRVLERLE